MKDIQATLDTALEQSGIPGAVAMIGNRAGEIAAAASGVADPASEKPMTNDCIFQIASMTKAVTSVAAMQLVERGVLSLDDPIRDVLPELAAPEIVAGFDDEGAAQLTPAKTPITLKHLLTHTSGLGYPFTSADMARAQGEVPPASLASICAPLVFEPGSNWLYGVSTDWVGIAVERASGQTLGEYMAQHIFAPLQMRDTGFAVSADNTPRRAALLTRTPDGFAPMPIEIGGGEAAEYQSGGAGLYSTAADYMRFMRMILNRGSSEDGRVLSEQSVAMMTSNQIGDLRAGEMTSTMPMLTHDFDPFPGMDTDWGLGFLINTETGPQGRSAGSLSWAGIANCYYWIDPARDLAAVVLMQFLPFADANALKLVGAIETSIYNSAYDAR